MKEHLKFTSYMIYKVHMKISTQKFSPDTVNIKHCVTNCTIVISIEFFVELILV